MTSLDCYGSRNNTHLHSDASHSTTSTSHVRLRQEASIMSSEDDIQGKLLASALVTPPRRRPAASSSTPRSPRSATASPSRSNARKVPHPRKPRNEEQVSARRRNALVMPGTTEVEASTVGKQSARLANGVEPSLASEGVGQIHRVARDGDSPELSLRAPPSPRSGGRSWEANTHRRAATVFDFGTSTQSWAGLTAPLTPPLTANPLASPKSQTKRKPSSDAFSGSDLEPPPRDAKDPRLTSDRASSPGVTQAANALGALVGLGLGPAFEEVAGAATGCAEASFGEDKTSAALAALSYVKSPPRAMTKASRTRKDGLVMRAPAPPGLRRSDAPRTPGPVTAQTVAAASGLGLGIAGISATPMNVDVSRDSPDSTSTSPSLADSPASNASSVPSIIITPPALIAVGVVTEDAPLEPGEMSPRTYAGAILSFTAPTKTSIDSGTFSQPAPHSPFATQPVQDSSTFATLDHFSPPAESPDQQASPRRRRVQPPSIRAQEQRRDEDDAAFAQIAAKVDELLSDFFYVSQNTRSWMLCRRFVTFIEDTLDPKVNPTSATMRMPSLVCARWIGEGEEREWVPSAIRAIWFETCVERLMEHVVSGMMALLADDRAPHDVPCALARVCSLLKKELEVPLEMSMMGQSSTALATPDATPPKGLGLAPSACIGDEHDTPCTQPSDSDMSLDVPLLLLGAPDAEETPHIGAAISGLVGAAPDTPPTSTDSESFCPLADPSEIFHARLTRTVTSLLEKGEAVRERANHLTVPLVRRGNRKRWAAANAEADSLKAQREANLQLASSGAITGTEFRHRERARAAVGSNKDRFTNTTTVRFVGELYRAKLVPIETLQAWLERLLFDTVFPGVPSIFELEAGCALLITVGATLDGEAYREACVARTRPVTPGSVNASGDGDGANVPQTPDRAAEVSVVSTTPRVASPSTLTPPSQRPDGAPANHWINVSPRVLRRSSVSPISTLSTGTLVSSPPNSTPSGADSPTWSPFALNISSSDASEAPAQSPARATLDASTARIAEIQTVPELSVNAQAWCADTLRLKQSGWKVNLAPTPFAKQPKKARNAK